MAAASSDSRRSWRGAQRGALVRRSRNVWRWLLSVLALCLVGLAIYWAWPRPIPRTHLLILSAEREDRTSPLVPYVAGDRRALLDWAAAANVPTSDLSLIDLETPASIRQWFSANDKGDERLVFERRGKSSGKHRLGKNDRLVIYVKAHGVALDVSKDDKPDIRPLLIKRLNEDDLATAWHQSDAHVISVMPLLEELSRLRDIQTLLVLDVVHVNYDPRLGLVFNAFPEALEHAVQKLPQNDNLAVVVCQSNGELSAGLPATGHSAVADAFVRALQREPKGPATLGLQAFVNKLEQRLAGFGGAGRTSFRQSAEALFLPASSARLAGFVLPTSPPPDAEGEKKKSGDAGRVVAQAVQNEASRAAPPVVHQATTAARQVSQAVGSVAPTSAPPASVPADKQAASADQAAKAPASAPAAKDAAAPAAAPAAPPSAALPPKTDLELAWEARDRLRANYRTAWTPAHVAPQQWRRIEAVLSGFDEELLPPGQEPRDPQTLATLSRDLQTLVAYFAGSRDMPVREDCSAVAASLTRFLNSPASRTFEARQPGALNQANEAVRIFAEALYRSRDYLRLHGQTANVPDGGPLLNDSLLDSLLTRLGTLRSHLSPVGLDDGRLTDVRLQELSRVAQEVDQDVQRLDGEIESYASTTAAAAPSAGQMLRARLLLGSPLLSAATREGLRRQQLAGEQPAASPASASDGSIGDRLATNMRLTRKFLEIAIPADLRDSPAASSVVDSDKTFSFSSLAIFDNQLVRHALVPTEWAVTGRSLRELDQQWPSVIKTLYERRLAGKSTPRGQDLFDIYRLSLLMDGRDARGLRSEGALDVAIAQPLRAPRILDQVALRFSPDRIQLPLPGSDAALVELALQVASDSPPPYTVSVNLDWNDREIEVVRQGTGPPIRRGANQVPMTSEQGTLALRVAPRRVSREGTNVSLTATATFGMSPAATRQAACVLPRPDVVELTLAGDSNLDAARRRTWLPSGQQGGRLKLFPNREKSFAIYLTNQSSEEKRVFARLYRVPRAAVDPSGRLFDPRSPAQLLAATAGYDARLSQPNADPSQILRGLLVAQSNDKEPIVLPSNQSPVRITLAPLASPAPAPAAPPVATRPADDTTDVTSGLVLVLTSADGRSPPHAKWIELQTHQPDDLLEIRDALYEQGRLSFKVALKDAYLVEEMGLSKQPLMLAWDSQPLPPEVQVQMKESPIGAEGEPIAAFSSNIASTVAWPIYVHLAADGYPRGLVAGLSARGNRPNVENFLTDRAPVVHVTRIGAAADRAGGQPQKSQYVFRPERGWLPYPSSTPEIAALPLGAKGQPVMVRVDPAAPTVRIDCDLGADVSLRHFSEGARLRLSLAGQNKQFTLDRQTTARLAAVEDGALRLASRVTDFQAIEFERIDVQQDRRVDLVAEVIGESIPPTPGSFASDKVTFILDRTPPAVSQVTAQKRLAAQNPMAAGPPPTVIAMQCRADDGQGAGISGVEFIVGFDRNQNDRLDGEERRPPVAGRPYGQGLYAAEYSLTDLPGEYLLVEAVARDNVEQASQPGYFSLHLPKPPVGGGQRTTFGGKKIEPEDERPNKKGR